MELHLIIHRMLLWEVRSLRRYQRRIKSQKLPKKRHRPECSKRFRQLIHFLGGSMRKRDSTGPPLRISSRLVRRRVSRINLSNRVVNLSKTLTHNMQTKEVRVRLLSTDHHRQKMNLTFSVKQRRTNTPKQRSTTKNSNSLSSSQVNRRRNLKPVQRHLIMLTTHGILTIIRQIITIVLMQISTIRIAGRARKSRCPRETK